MLIQRKEYLEFLQLFKDKNLIKVISGIRRAGKSTLFELFKELLKQQGVQEKQIISINFESPEYDEISWKTLYFQIKEQLNPNKQNYVFLDEIQNVEKFEKVVDGLYILKNVDLYITGSNAYFMSGELATYLSGRYIELKMLPLSLAEYKEGNPNLSKNELYQKYITKSSFPYTLFIADKAITTYLKDIYNTIFLKDIVQRYGISDVLTLESISKFMLDNIGNRLSSRKIADTLTSNGRKINSKTAEKYMQALRDSLLFYEVKRYDTKGKQHLKFYEKFYVVDCGIRYSLLGKKAFDHRKVLENVIYLELLRRGYDVYIGKIDDLEVDFVAFNSDGVQYYQVALTLRDEKTLLRELTSLENINDHYPKFLLTLDDDPIMYHNGIKQINAIDWLLENHDNKHD